MGRGRGFKMKAAEHLPDHSHVRLPFARRRWTHVALILIALEVSAFWGYFNGSTIPEWDFLGSYLTEAHAWWQRSGLFAPVEWMPYAWMGFPAAASLQNSAYYLPVGLASLAGPYTPWAAAVVSAIHAAWGAFGMYVLVRRLLYSHPAALLGMVAFFFSPGFFANAEHVDIVRGFAWTPWLLILFSPLWPWNRRWAVPLGALFLWQFLVGSYPGIIVMAAYCLFVWSGMWLLLRSDVWSWVPRLALVGASGVMLSLVKFGPALSFGVGTYEVVTQAAGVNLEVLATLFYPYDHPAMPYDITMRPFFVVAAVLLLIPWAPWNARRLRPVLALGLISVVIIAGTRYADSVLRLLPGLQMSRFRVNDVKPFLLAATILLGCAGLVMFQSLKVQRRRRWAGSGAVVALAVGLTFVVPLPPDSLGARRMMIPLLLVAGSLMALAVVDITRARARPSGLLVPLVVGISAASGLFFAYAVPAPWHASRIPAEEHYFGSTVSELLTSGDCTQPQERRATRTAPSKAELDTSKVALAGAYACTDSVGGYLNVKTLPTMVKQLEALRDPSHGAEAFDFYTAAGAVAPVIDAKLVDLSPQCLQQGICTGLTYQPRGYEPGRLVYEVTSHRAQTVALNESFYPGWTARLCRAGTPGSCEELTPRPGPFESVAVDLPAGTHMLTVTYRTPLMPVWWTTFWVGVLLALVGLALPGYGRATGASRPGAGVCTGSPLDRVVELLRGREKLQ